MVRDLVQQFSLELDKALRAVSHILNVVEYWGIGIINEREESDIGVTELAVVIPNSGLFGSGAEGEHIQCGVLDADAAVGGAGVASAEDEAVCGVGTRPVCMGAEAGVERGEETEELVEVGLVGAVGCVVTPATTVEEWVGRTATEM